MITSWLIMAIPNSINTRRRIFSMAIFIFFYYLLKNYLPHLAYFVFSPQWKKSFGLNNAILLKQ